MALGVDAGQTGVASAIASMLIDRPLSVVGGRIHFASSKTAFTLPLRTARSSAAWSFSFWSA